MFTSSNGLWWPFVYIMQWNDRTNSCLFFQDSSIAIIIKWTNTTTRILLSWAHWKMLNQVIIWCVCRCMWSDQEMATLFYPWQIPQTGPPISSMKSVSWSWCYVIRIFLPEIESNHRYTHAWWHGSFDNLSSGFKFAMLDDNLCCNGW